jgi:hypothetical protein
VLFLSRVLGLEIFLTGFFLSFTVFGHVVSLPLLNRGDYKMFKMVPISVALEHKKFVCIDTEESILYLDQVRQYYFMTDER